MSISNNCLTKRGMGGFTAMRNHLYNLFPLVFKREIPEKTQFSLVIVDLMQFLAGKINAHAGGSALDVEEVTASMRWTVESYLPNNHVAYQATKALVILLDTPKNVPTNKAGEQQKRSLGGSSKIMDETLFKQHDDGVHCMGSFLKWPLAGETIWRSNNTKFHLYALITEALLKITPPGQVKLVLDDGVDIHHDLYRQRYEEMVRDHHFEHRSSYEKECLVSNLARHNFTERFVIRGEEGKGLYNNTVERLVQTYIGEADVKIPGFINLDEETMVTGQDTDFIFILLLRLKGILPDDPSEAEPTFELWLDSQKPKDRREGRSKPYRFLDVKALYYAILALFAREYPTVTHPIETLIFLVYSGKTDYTSNFDTYLKVTPRVVWNTFSALHTEPGVLKEKGYLLFNDAMYDEQTIKVTEKKTREKEMAKMGIKRSAVRQSPYPAQWQCVLSEAVSCTHNPLNDHFDLTLDDVKCQSFLYLLCQFKVIDDLSSLGHTQFNKKAKQRTYIPTSDELFMWISRIETQVDAYRHEPTKIEDSNKRKAVELHFLIAKAKTETERERKRPKLLQRYLPRANPTDPLIAAPEHQQPKRLLKLKPMVCEFNEPRKSAVLEFLEDIEEIEIDKEREHKPSIGSIVARPVTTLTISRKLETMCKKTIPKQYGVPNLQAMLARICRTAWIMNYHQNGWNTPRYVTNFSDTHPSDANLSCHGWKAEEIVQNEESIRQGAWNNSYFTSTYQVGTGPGVIPFRVFRMVETDLVYNNSHAAYRIASL